MAALAGLRALGTVHAPPLPHRAKVCATVAFTPVAKHENSGPHVCMANASPTEPSPQTPHRPRPLLLLLRLPHISQGSQETSVAENVF